nr:translation initiation factor IF-2-like [Aegilops tauschii subsp. strangulata]
MTKDVLCLGPGFPHKVRTVKKACSSLPAVSSARGAAPAASSPASLLPYHCRCFLPTPARAAARAAPYSRPGERQRHPAPLLRLAPSARTEAPAKTARLLLASSAFSSRTHCAARLSARPPSSNAAPLPAPPLRAACPGSPRQRARALPAPPVAAFPAGGAPATPAPGRLGPPPRELPRRRSSPQPPARAGRPSCPGLPRAVPSAPVRPPAPPAPPTARIAPAHRPACRRSINRALTVRARRLPPCAGRLPLLPSRRLPPPGLLVSPQPGLLRSSASAGSPAAASPLLPLRPSAPPSSARATAGRLAAALHRLRPQGRMAARLRPPRRLRLLRAGCGAPARRLCPHRLPCNPACRLRPVPASPLLNCIMMSSAAPAAAVVAPTSVAAVAPVLAPTSPFLASRPLAVAYGALPPPGSPIGSGASGDPASTSTEIVAPPPYGVAAPPPYGAASPMPYGSNSYGAVPVAPGAPPPPSSSWQVVSYGGAATSLQPPSGSAVAPLQQSYGAAVTPQPQPHGAAAASPYGAHVALDYGALAAGPPGEAWAALHTSFASQSQARAHSIRTDLGETKLGDLSITDYFNKMTGLADTLASVGQQPQDEEFTTYVLNGLDDDYDNLIENVHGRDDPLPPRELYARLLGHEQRIKARRVSPGFVSANAVTRGKPPKSSSSGGKTAPSSQQASRGNAPTITGGSRSVA